MLSASQTQHVGFYDENGEWWHTQCIAEAYPDEWAQATADFEEAGSNDWDDSVPDRFGELIGAEWTIRYLLHEYEAALKEDEVTYQCEQQWSDLPEELQEALVEAFEQAFDDSDAPSWDDKRIVVNVYDVIEQFVYDSDDLGKAVCTQCNLPIE